jgi:hypothetical protein
MALIVGGRIDVHFDDPDAGVLRMLGNPVGCYKYISHSGLLLFSCSPSSY